MADPIGRVISKIQDAALDPRLWSSVLQSVAETAGAIGAAYIVRNARTGRVDWANFLSPSAKFASDYIARFAAQDRFIEHLTRYEGTWMRLSEQLPATELQRNEWYTDFVLKSGVRDIVAAQVSIPKSHQVILGVHEGIGEEPLPTANLKRLDQLLEPIRRAAEVQIRLRELGWKSAVLARAFDQVSTGIIVVDASSSVIEMNGHSPSGWSGAATASCSTMARSAPRGSSRPRSLERRFHRRPDLERKRRAAAFSSAGTTANTTTFWPCRRSASISASTPIRWPSSSSSTPRRDRPRPRTSQLAFASVHRSYPLRFLRA